MNACGHLSRTFFRAGKRDEGRVGERKEELQGGREGRRAKGKEAKFSIIHFYYRMRLKR